MIIKIATSHFVATKSLLFYFIKLIPSAAYDILEIKGAKGRIKSDFLPSARVDKFIALI